MKKIHFGFQYLFLFFIIASCAGSRPPVRVVPKPASKVSAPDPDEKVKSQSRPLPDSTRYVRGPLISSESREIEKETLLIKPSREQGPVDLKTDKFTVQVGAFRDKDNVMMLARRLEVIFDYVNIIEYKDDNMVTLYRLHVSKTTALDEARKMEEKLIDLGFTGAFILRF